MEHLRMLNSLAMVLPLIPFIRPSHPSKDGREPCQKREDCDYYCTSPFEKLFETEYYSPIDSKVKESEN